MLLERTTQLKHQMESKHISLIEEELKSIFIDLKNLISPNDLDLGIAVMENGTLILEQKIEEVKRFINYLSQKDQIIQFLTSSATDQQLETILSQVWHCPIKIPYLSLDYINEKWIKLVKNKTQRKQNQFSELPAINEKSVVPLTEFTDPFEKQMQNFLIFIIPILPASLDKILNKLGDIEQYFEQFSLILHLLQEGFLHYEKKTQQFTLGETKFE